MSTYQTQQQHVVHRGRSFHFVSYEGHPADPKLELSDTPPAWFLIYAGRRWMAFPQVGDAAPAVLARQFEAWLDARACDAPRALQCQQPASAGAATPARRAKARGVPVPLAGQ